MTQLDILLTAAVLHLALLFAHGTYIALALGISWGTGRRDGQVLVPDMGRRFDRTITNNVESMIAFVPIMLVSIVSDVSNSLAVSAGVVFLGARVMFAVLYIANVPYLRTVAWLTGQFALVTIVYVLIQEI